MDTIEYRAVIKFLTKEGQKTTDIHARLMNVYGEEAPSISTVSLWVGLFRRGRESLQDDHGDKRPADLRPENMIKNIEQLVAENSRLTKRDLAELLGISDTLVVEILRKDLLMKKVSGRWVPKSMMPTFKHARLEASKAFLEMTQTDLNSVVHRIVVSDEQSIKWHAKDDLAPTVSKRCRKAGIFKVIYFWDSKGILLIDYPQSNIAIAGAYYAELIKKLCFTIKQKRPDLLGRGVLLKLHDNAKVNIVSKAVRICGFKELYYPTHSPDLNPSDYFLLPQLKKTFKGKQFECAAETKVAFENFLKCKEQDWYFNGLAELKDRSEKCVCAKGEYIKKLTNTD